jgi:hypothetical protein
MKDELKLRTRPLAQSRYNGNKKRGKGKLYFTNLRDARAVVKQRKKKMIWRMQFRGKYLVGTEKQFLKRKHLFHCPYYDEDDQKRKK